MGSTDQTQWVIETDDGEGKRRKQKKQRGRQREKGESMKLSGRCCLKVSRKSFRREQM